MELKGGKSTQTYLSDSTLLCKSIGDRSPPWQPEEQYQRQEIARDEVAAMNLSLAG
jgi:hypothetical protein